MCHFQTLVWTFGVQSLTMRMTPKNPIATRKCKSVYVGQKTQRRFLKLMEKRGGGVKGRSLILYVIFPNLAIKITKVPQSAKIL